MVYFGLLLFGIAIFIKVIHIQYVEGSELKEKALEETIQAIDIEPTRGTIYAADGKVLATSVPIFDVRMDAGSDVITDNFFYQSIDSLAFCLSNLFNDRSQANYRNELINARKKGNRYYLIKRSVEFEQLKKLRNFPIFRKGKFKGGLIIIPKDRREMPFRSLAKRTIGFSRGDVYVGLEGAFTKELAGVKGKKLMQRTANGWIPLTDESLVEPEKGKDIITTLEVNIQDVAQDALRRQLVLHKASHGCAILMEVKTGHIKAIVNLTRDTATDWYDEKYNYAIGESSEPGSTFKLISMLIALDDEMIDLDDSVNTGNGKTMYFSRTMSDSHEGGYGKISVKRAFEVSSNVGISRIIYKAYANNPQRFTDKLVAMKINKSLELEIDGEGKPLIKSPKNKNTWYGTTLPWMSIGYELAMTPLQILTVYNAVANNGKMVKPMFVDQIKVTGKVIKQYDTQIINEEIASQKAIKKAREMLEGVVQSGTAVNIRNSVYKIAGKTGTAQIAVGSGGYNKSNYKASFAGYFPADDPMYSCIVVINNPSTGAYYGSSVAAPVFKEIADKVYAMQLNIHAKNENINRDTILPITKSGNQKQLSKVYNELKIKTVSNDPGSEWVIPVQNDSLVKFLAKNIRYGYVPDVIGMGVNDAVFLLEQMGMTVIIRGRGMVISQSIEQGTKVTKGTKIILELRT